MQQLIAKMMIGIISEHITDIIISVDLIDN